MGLFRFSIENRPFVNVVMAILLLLGAYVFVKMPWELNPEISFNWAFIITTYPGTSPEEVEQLITIPLEDEVADLPHIEILSSTSSEGRSVISVKFESMSKERFRDLLRDVQREVDKVTTLPAEAEKPIIIDFDSYTWEPLIRVVLRGNVPEREMREAARDLRDRFRSIKHVREVREQGLRDREIWVEVDPKRLAGYRLSLSQVAEAIRSRGMNLPGGTIKGARSEYLLRTVGEFRGPEEIKEVVLRSENAGAQVKLSDIATVAETFEEPQSLSRFNGERAMVLTVVKDGPGNSITIVKKIREIAGQFLDQAPPGLSIDYINDTSENIKEILDKLGWNAVIGGVFLLSILYLTMGFTPAMLAAWGLPVAYAGTFIAMALFGESLNHSSLFGIILVSGMLVDDAIVILENCYRYLEKGYDSARAILVGAREVAAPVMNSSFTTIATFLPLMFMTGIVGKFMRIIPLVVTLALLASLFEALLILPSHIHEWGRPQRGRRRALFFRRLWRGYRKILKLSLRYRYAVLVITIAMAGAAPLLIPLMGIDMFAEEELPQFVVRAETRVGSKLTETSNLIKGVEEAALALPASEVRAVAASVGIMHTEKEIVRASNAAELLVDMREEGDQVPRPGQVIEELRARTSRLSGFTSLEFVKPTTGPPLGKPVEVKVVGKMLPTLREVADQVKQNLRSKRGVYDVADDFRSGKEEVRVRVDEERAAALGLSVASIADAIRSAFEGKVASVVREGDEEIDVVVKFDQWSRGRIATVEEMLLTTPQGSLIPFKQVALIAVERGPAEIRRFDRNRAVTVSAQVNKEETTAVQVNQQLVADFQDVARRYPGYRLDFRGEFQEFKEAFTSLKFLFAVGVMLVYLLLTAQFKSFSQPLIIIFTVPFSFMGAVLGLLVIGSPFSIVALYGTVALAGVAVNDGIVLMDFINKCRWTGASRYRAVMGACRVRLRPILLTTVTTIAGLLPTAIGIGGKSAIWMPLANTIVWGLAVSTLLTLIMVPSFYLIADDLKRVLGRANPPQ